MPVVASAATGAAPSTDVRRRECAIAVKEEKIEMEGEITEALRNRMFRLKLDNGHEMIGYTAGTDEAVPDPDAPRRPRAGRAVPVRPRPRPHRLPAPVARRTRWPTESNSCRPSSRACSPCTSRRSPTASGPSSCSSRSAAGGGPAARPTRPEPKVSAFLDFFDRAEQQELTDRTLEAGSVDELRDAFRRGLSCL